MNQYKQIIVGFAGAAGCGKDTAANYLLQLYKQRFPDAPAQIISFAGPLKAGLAAMGLPEPADRALKEQIIEGFGFSWRDAAQTLGTEWGRTLDSQLWVKLAMQKVTEQGLTIFSDVRFVNEAVTIHEKLGTIIRLTNRKILLPDHLANHKSEEALSDTWCHYSINNSGGLDFLHSNLKLILEELLPELK